MERQAKAGQSRLILGFRTPITLRTPDFYAMLMCHEILGASPISRLFVHVREKHGLCYTCTSEYHIEHGSVIVYCGLSEQHRPLLEKAILDQLEVIKEGAFTDAEWLAAQKSLQANYRQILDSPRALADFYELRAVLGLNQTPEECSRRISEVTKEQVVAAARSLCLDVVFFQKGAMDGQDSAHEEEDEYEW